MNSKLILFISPLPPPFYGSAISSQACLKTLKKSNKYRVKNVKVNFSKEFSDIEKISFQKIVGLISGLYKIIHISLKFRPDLVYIMPATKGLAFFRDFSYSLIAKLLNKNIIYHLRTQFTDRQKKNKFKNFIFRTAFNNSKVIVLGPELKENIKTYLKLSDIFILPNALADSVKEEDIQRSEKEKLTSKKLRLIFISNMMKSKGWKKTIDAAAILKQRNIEFSLHFAGSWPSKKVEEEYFKLINDLGLQENIFYMGYLNEKQKKKILSESDVMVFPTEYKYEALPRVIIEAYKYGLPVISTYNGSIPSLIVHEHTGFLLKENTPDEIAESVIKLCDKEKLIQLGRNARQRFLSNYEISVFNKNFQKIIDKCI